MTARQEFFESKFADNFSPSSLEAFVKKYETYRADAMAEMISKEEGVFVDFACGDGNFLHKVAENFERLIGFDINKHRISNSKQALRKYAKKVELYTHDLDQKLPLKTSSISVAVCEASIGCLVHPESFLKEVHRVLKKDGEFIVQMGNYAYLPRRIAFLLGELPKISSFKGFGDGGMLHYFTYDSLKELLEASGFIVVETSNSGVMASVRKLAPKLFAPDIIYRAVKV